MKGLGQKHEEMVQRVIDAQKAGDTSHVVPLGKRISFCTTSFKRGWQLRRALPVNLLSLWPYRKSVRLVLCVFDSDVTKDHLLLWIRTTCRAALEEGLLVME